MLKNPNKLNQAVYNSKMYGDFAPGTFSFGPYENPFTKENIDALPAATRQELLNRNDAVGDMIRQTYYGTNSQTNSNVTGTNIQSSVSITNYSTTAQMMANDPSAQETFKMLSKMPDAQKLIALNALPSDMKAAYDIWSTSQSSQIRPTVENTINNGKLSNISSSVNTSKTIIENSSLSSQNNTSTISTIPNNANENVKASPSITMVENINTSTSDTLILNNSIINELISKIDNTIVFLEEFISQIENKEINIINNSWVAEEANVYVNKVQNANLKIRKVIEGLNLLKNAFIRSLEESSSTNQNLNTILNNM